METDTLKVTPREPKGSKAAARVRRADGVPAVLYGGGKEVQHLDVPLEPFEHMLRKHKRVLTLDVNGVRSLAFLKDVQHNALGDEVVHIDFLRVDETKQIRVRVPLEFAGHPKGLGNGGEFVHPMNEVEVECLPTSIPESVKIKVDHLDVDMSITAKELTLPAGVKLVSPPDAIVCTVHMKGLEPTVAAAPGAEVGPAEPERIVKPAATAEEGEAPEKAEKTEKK
jgi:large subunit ribosomal protein L25